MKDKIDIIKEMTVEDAKLLPDAVRKSILDSVEEPVEVKTVVELREALGVDSKADVVQLVTEMVNKQAEAQKQAIQQAISEIVKDEERGIKVEAMRGMVTELVKAKNPQTVAEVEAAYAEVVEREDVKSALKLHVQEMSGPNHGKKPGSKGGNSPQFIPGLAKVRAEKDEDK